MGDDINTASDGGILRSAFQLHLSTVVILTVEAGILVWIGVGLAEHNSQVDSEPDWKQSRRLIGFATFCLEVLIFSGYFVERWTRRKKNLSERS